MNGKGSKTKKRGASTASKKKGKKVHDVSPSASESEELEESASSGKDCAGSSDPSGKKEANEKAANQASAYASIDEGTLLEVLKRRFGHNGFRSAHQRAAISCLLTGQHDVFVSMPTGKPHFS